MNEIDGIKVGRVEVRGIFPTHDDHDPLIRLPFSEKEAKSRARERLEEWKLHNGVRD